MDVKSALVEGLTSYPKYVPVWYAYDKQGSLLFDKCYPGNPNYYLKKSEVSILTQYLTNIVETVSIPYTLVELGSGNSEKSRMFIHAILEMQATLTYIPIDISAEFLKETCEALTKEYGSKVKVNPVASDYSEGIKMLREIPGRKLIMWLGGGILHLPYKVQMETLNRLSSNMTDADRLIVTFDITQDTTVVDKAYHADYLSPFHMNAILRLNREYGSSIDTDKFSVTTTFLKSTKPGELSAVLLRARSKCNQEYNIQGLGIAIEFEEGEYLNFYEGEGTSCKYTKDQVQTLANKGNQHIDDIWIDDGDHVAVCCFKKNVDLY